MPTYAYECEKCGLEFEVEQSIHDKPRSRCPECRGKVHKVFNSVGIVFKGSGFYCTDSRGGKSNGKVGTKKPCESTGTCPSESCSTDSGKASSPSCTSCQS